MITVCGIAFFVWIADDIHNRTTAQVEPMTINLSADQSLPAISSFAGKDVKMFTHGDTTEVCEGYECADNDACEVIMSQAAAAPKPKVIARIIKQH